MKTTFVMVGFLVLIGSVVFAQQPAGCPRFRFLVPGSWGRFSSSLLSEHLALSF